MTSGAAPGRAVLPAQQAATAASYAEQYPDMLLRYLSARFNALSERWDRERAAIRTAEAVAERNRFVRGKFIEMIHGYPERNPLRPVVVKVLERDGYRVENILFESRPNFFVTGNLYVPTSGPGHRWPVHIAPGGPFGPSDVEQNLFPSALYGADLCDLHVAIAPRPLLTLTEEYTPWFNLAAGHIRDRYRQLGVAEKFSTEEATDWFSRWF